MLFHFEPESPLTERLRFLTDVFVHKNGSEQRVNLRLAPRQEFDFTLLVENADRQRLENIFFGAQTDPIDIPVWSDGAILSASASIGATSVTFDDMGEFCLSFGDFRVGGKAMIVSGDTHELVENLAFSLGSPGALSFDTTLANAYPKGATVYPVRPAQIGGQVRVQRYAVNLTQYTVPFQVTDNVVDLADGTTLGLFESVPFLDDPNAITDTLAEGYEREVHIIDGNTGAFSQVSFWDRSRRTSAKTFKTFSRSQLWYVRKFLHWMKGQQKSFYLPTFGHELTASTNIVSGTTGLTVVNAGYSTYSQARTPRSVVRVAKTDGTMYTKHVTDANEVDEDTEQLTVNTAWGANVNVADIARIDILERVRMDTDDITIIHDNNLGQSTIGFPVKAVFE